jgi:hypothetical protein
MKHLESYHMANNNIYGFLDLILKIDSFYFKVPPCKNYFFENKDDLCFL